MIKRPLQIILACLLSALPLHAAKFSGEAFSLGVGARPLALGGAVVAGPFDGSAPYWNPAGMNYLSGRRVTAMHAETFGSLLNHDFVSYVDARSPGDTKVGAFGFYLYYLGGGGIKITQLNEFDRPFVVREESHGDWLLASAISGKIGQVDIGATGKIIYRDIGTESGFGLTVDFGALYRLHKHVNFGLMITDVTTGFIRYSGNTELFDSDGNPVAREASTESIYPAVKPGLMFEYGYTDFVGRFLASGDVRFESLEGSAQVWGGPFSLDSHFGLELAYREMLFGRTGFDIGRFTAGAGVAVKRLTIDFAYLHHDDLDETFRVSAGYQF